jgi:hypothetical protein
MQKFHVVFDSPFYPGAKVFIVKQNNRKKVKSHQIDERTVEHITASAVYKDGHMESSIKIKASGLATLVSHAECFPSWEAAAKSFSEDQSPDMSAMFIAGTDPVGEESSAPVAGQKDLLAVDLTGDKTFICLLIQHTQASPKDL